MNSVSQALASLSPSLVRPSVLIRVSDSSMTSTAPEFRATCAAKPILRKAGLFSLLSMRALRKNAGMPSSWSMLMTKLVFPVPGTPWMSMLPWPLLRIEATISRLKPETGKLSSLKTRPGHMDSRVSIEANSVSGLAKNERISLSSRKCGGGKKSGSTKPMRTRVPAGDRRRLVSLASEPVQSASAWWNSCRLIESKKASIGR